VEEYGYKFLPPSLDTRSWRGLPSTNNVIGHVKIGRHHARAKQLRRRTRENYSENENYSSARARRAIAVVAVRTRPNSGLGDPIWWAWRACVRIRMVGGKQWAHENTVRVQRVSGFVLSSIANRKGNDEKPTEVFRTVSKRYNLPAIITIHLCVRVRCWPTIDNDPF